jgi:hypothetical protein
LIELRKILPKFLFSLSLSSTKLLAAWVPATDRQSLDLVDLGEVRLSLRVRPTSGDDCGNGDGVHGHVSR